jgi:hypothetical protein
MNDCHLSEKKSPPWWNLIVLALMSLAAPCIAAFIHSACVFYSGIRFYNAELWRLSDQPGFWNVLARIGSYGGPGCVTFFILLPFRKHRLVSWIIWACCVILWLGVFFEMEIAIH